jgi:hypothetical protein
MSDGFVTKKLKQIKEELKKETINNQSIFIYLNEAIDNSIQIDTLIDKLGGKQ